MKASTIGIWVLVIGVCIGGYAATMTTSVQVNYEHGNPLNLPDNVANLGLMNDRLSLLLISGIMCIIGTILIISPDSSLMLHHARAQTKILALIAAQQSVKPDMLNSVIKEINDVEGNPLEFEHADNESDGTIYNEKQLLLSQLNLLGSIAGKIEVPVEEINNVMQPYGVVFEE